MKTFIHEDFLLHNEVAKKLFHQHAKKMPIIDYHCHLDPKEIYEDKKFRNLFDAWLSGDHYKWRLMRANGVTEDYITGNKPEFDKFMKWAEVVPTLVGNPLYHWTHFELKRFFGIDTLLSPETAEDIYKEVNQKLESLTARKLIEMSHVDVICTTDDPIDSLEWHDKLNEDQNFKTTVLPAFRPDKAINIELPWFQEWIIKLGKVVGYTLSNINLLKKAITERIEFFHEKGCRLSDHALDVVSYERTTNEEIAMIYEKAMQHEDLTPREIRKYKGYLLVFLGQEYKKRDWVQQYHIGALRNLSERMLKNLGPDTGFDAINDGLIAKPLSQLMDALDATGDLPKTILYTLNPRDFEVAITLMQAFQGGGIAGKIQFGSAWWFLDTIDGMTKQIKALANNGLLSRFVGMLTDSRSFLSYPRHEYFRRLLCNIIGEQVMLGYFPEDYTLLGKMVEDISYRNAKDYFNF
ncbi:glucuronate isomerase [Peloplasma aerotolerans]|uniref:Uronate isomerase n=1 Tax=Peloplasma aerotolerans TaxID=3044389 RepID=A0AAW6U6E9_9MOLU|nr:glucuronate isomerase [Mariniplasma sp. M4Ah]MDI6452485.1 glucuronate isomerase [Mariniplasma sp. M4Ah]